MAYEKWGEFARAFQDFDRALEIDPGYGVAYYSRETMLSNSKKPALTFKDFEMVNHLMAMRLKHFDGKVPRDLAIQASAIREPKTDKSIPGHPTSDLCIPRRSLPKRSRIFCYMI